MVVEGKWDFLINVAAFYLSRKWVSRFNKLSNFIVLFCCNEVHVKTGLKIEHVRKKTSTTKTNFRPKRNPRSRWSKEEMGLIFRHFIYGCTTLQIHILALKHVTFWLRSDVDQCTPHMSNANKSLLRKSFTLFKLAEVHDCFFCDLLQVTNFVDIFIEA